MKQLPILFIMLTIILCNSVNAEGIMMLKTTNTAPKYELITSITLGPFGYESKGSTEIPYRYRVLVSTFEIYEDLFIEKLKINNEEGIPQGVEWSRRLDLIPLLEEFNISTEQQKIGHFEWLSPVSFRFSLGGKTVVLEDIRQLKIKVKPN
jgi:hypothetical protein